MKYLKCFLNGGNTSNNPIVETHVIPTKRGKLYCKKIYQRKKRDLTPIIAVHGGPGVPHNYLIPLSEAVNGRPIILYDQIGCGESDKPTLDDKLWAMSYFIDEIVRIREYFHLPRFHLYGHSWGAAICIAYVRRENENAHVQSLTLASPLISVPQWAKDGQKLLDGLTEFSKYKFLELEANNIFSGEAYAAISQEYVNKFLCRIKPWPEHLVQALKLSSAETRYKLWGNKGPRFPNGLHKDLDLSAELDRLNTPVLITAGQYDSARPETLQEYVKAIPKAKISILEDTSHMPHLEAPERYKAILSEFIESNDFVYGSTIKSKL